jgi:hypothetical protein
MKISKTLALRCEPPSTETQPAANPSPLATNEPRTNVSKPANPSSPVFPR